MKGGCMELVPIVVVIAWAILMCGGLIGVVLVFQGRKAGGYRLIYAAIALSLLLAIGTGVAAKWALRQSH